MNTLTAAEFRGQPAIEMVDTRAVGSGARVIALAPPAVRVVAASPSPQLRFAAPRGDRALAKLVLRRDGRFVVLRTADGRRLARRRLAGLRTIAIDGADGRVNNTLTVDLSGGAIAVPRGIRYDGGFGGFNRLAVTGGRVRSSEDRPLGRHSGWEIDGATRIRYANVAPTTDSVSGPVTFSDFHGNDPIDVFTTSSGAMTIAGPSFESLTVQNKTAITFHLVSGGASLTVGAPTAETGMTSLTIASISSPTPNSVTLAATPPGIPVTVDGGPGEKVTVGQATGTEAIAGALVVSFANGPGRLVLDDEADPTARTPTITPTTVSGLTPSAVGYSGADTLAVEGGSGPDTFTATASPSTAYMLDGGGPAPPSVAGDTLVLNAAGTSLASAATPSGVQGSWVFGAGAPAIQFSDFENLTPTAVSAGDATVDPGRSGTETLLFPVTLAAPSTAPVQVAYATADGSATAAAGRYLATSGTLTFAPGQTTQTIPVAVPGTTAAGPAVTMELNLGSVSGAVLSRSQGTGTILDSNPPAVPAPVTPAITKLAQSRTTWRLGTTAAKLSAAKKPATGTTFSFTLNVAATVEVTFSKSTTGRRVGGKCVASTKANRHDAACSRSTSAGSLSVAGHAGANRLAFAGRLSSSRKLSAGRYAAKFVATAGGRHSTTATLHFTTVK